MDTTVSTPNNPSSMIDTTEAIERSVKSSDYVMQHCNFPNMVLFHLCPNAKNYIY